MTIPETIWTSTVVAMLARDCMARDKRIPANRAVQQAAKQLGFQNRADPNGVLLKAVVLVMSGGEAA